MQVQRLKCDGRGAGAGFDGPPLIHTYMIDMYHRARDMATTFKISVRSQHIC
jgi:hypothetical protein